MTAHARSLAPESTEAARLRQFLFWDIVISLISAVAMPVLYALFPSPFFLIMDVEILLNAVLLIWARQHVERNIDGTVTAIAAGIWVIAATLGLLAPVVIPIALLLVVLSVMLALPYIGRRALMRLIGGAALVSGIIVSLQLADGPLPLDVIPESVIVAVVAISAPATVGLIFLLVWQYSSRLGETLAQTRAANRALRESERQLEAKVAKRTGELTATNAQPSISPTSLKIRPHFWLYAPMRGGLELSSHVSPDVPTALVGDPLRLRQIITNLMGNAIKFTKQGEVALHVENDSETDGDASLLFRVSDTGIGIPPDKLEAIFDSFSQADSSTTREYGGTGLGLAISRRLVEMMGGRLWVESEVGRGSTFHFTAKFEAQAEPQAPDDLSWKSVEGLKTLIVDDNATNRLILKETVGAWGISATEVEDGYMALAELDRARTAGQP